MPTEIIMFLVCVLKCPLFLTNQLQFRVRMHYGHPDVFDRIFHISRGGISKASRGINLSEDIFAGASSLPVNELLLLSEALC